MAKGDKKKKAGVMDLPGDAVVETPVQGSGLEVQGSEGASAEPSGNPAIQNPKSEIQNSEDTPEARIAAARLKYPWLASDLVKRAPLREKKAGQ